MHGQTRSDILKVGGCFQGGKDGPCHQGSTTTEMWRVCLRQGSSLRYFKGLTVVTVGILFIQNREKSTLFEKVKTL